MKMSVSCFFSILFFVGGLFGCGTVFAENIRVVNRVKNKSSYQFLLFGGAYFDDAEFHIYHSDYNNPDLKTDRVYRAEMTRATNMWRKLMPQMIQAARNKITPKTAFVIQTGNLIQGDCGNPKTHVKMIRDALSYFKKNLDNLPVLTTVGENDIRGTDAKNTYYKTMSEFMGEELGLNLQSMNFYFKYGRDLYLVVDYNHAYRSFVTTVLQKFPYARYKFIIVHEPVLPSDCENCMEFLYNKYKYKRQEMRNAFLGSNVIVLSGHTHKLEFTKCSTALGSISQININSMRINTNLDKPNVLFTKAKDYGLLQRTKYHNKNGVKLFLDYRDYISEYYSADAAGYFVLNVSDDGVTADFYGGNIPEKTASFKLR
ncbi:MAG: hypothetical protein WCS73_01775 [Lentisphaeria bacterium]